MWVLSGPDSNDGTYSTSQLAGTATGTDTVSSGGYTGISVWGLLGGSTTGSTTLNGDGSTTITYGGITTNTPAGDNTNNPILRYYLVGIGAGGQQSVVSLGEIDPFFGGTSATPAFIAYQNTGSGLLASSVPHRARSARQNSRQSHWPGTSGGTRSDEPGRRHFIHGGGVVGQCRQTRQLFAGEP